MPTPRAKTFSYEGTHIGYRLIGQQTNPKKVWVFLSGWGFGSIMGKVAWEGQIAKDDLLITIDVPGIGSMREGSAFVYIPRLAAAVAAFLRTLDINEPTVVGHAYGSMIAQELAISHDDAVGKLILICPTSGIGGVQTSLASSMTLMNRLLTGQDTVWTAMYTAGYLAHMKAVLGDVFEDLQRPTSMEALSGQVWAASRWSNWGRTQHIYQKTLMILGEVDPLTSLPQAKLLATQLPNCTVETIPCGFLPFVECADAVKTAVATFLKS